MQPEPNLTSDMLDVVPLTDDQEDAIKRILDWLDSTTGPREFRLGGYAGTGKTTVLKELRKDLGSTHHSVVCAFTGKAVHVLQRKGITAQTMHSLMYRVIDNGDGTFDFELKRELEDDPDVVIVDEASMVSTELLDHLRSFNTKILFVGDPGQLEPVGDNPNLMRDPDYVLQHIHRQAQQSPIIRLATDVRMGKPPRHHIDGDLVVRPKQLRVSDYLSVDQVLCAKNTTRQRLNTALRVWKRYPAYQLVVGEKLICLRNSRALGVFNGMILFIDKIHSEGSTFWEVDLHDEVNRKFGRIKLWKEPFIIPLVDTTRIPKFHLYADYGYVITCHKSQGSEWDSVLVQDEYIPIWDMKRWRYTAITRAAKKLTYCI